MAPSSMEVVAVPAIGEVWPSGYVAAPRNDDMAKEKHRRKRRPYKARNGRRVGAQADEDRRLKDIELANRRFVAAMEALDKGEPADIDGPLLAMMKLSEEAPDRARLQSRILGRLVARGELEDWGAHAFLSGVLSAVVRALQVVAADPSELRDRPQAWLDAQDRARLLGEQLLAFCATRGINATEWSKGSSFIDLLSDLDKAAMIERLRASGVTIGKDRLDVMQRDACAVVGVNEDYTANVRRRHKNPVKKTG